MSHYKFIKLLNRFATLEGERSQATILLNLNKNTYKIYSPSGRTFVKLNKSKYILAGSSNVRNKN